MSAVKKIAETIKSIPGKKESLRGSLEVLRSYSSSLATFNLERKDLENHLSAIEKSIDDRFKALEAKEETNNTSTTNKNDKFAIFRKEKEEEEELSPPTELESICVRMDGMGLAAFLEKMRVEDIDTINKDLAPALRLTSDPAQLVLTAVGFYSNPLNSKSSRSDYAPSLKMRSCLCLLEKLQLVAPEIGPTVREKALMQAAEWKSKISFDNGKDHSLEVFAFLQLIASFGIVARFDHEEVLELFSTISRRFEKHAMVLIKNLDLIDNSPEIIQKLCSKGRHLHAVKVIYAYDMVEKVPPVPLLEAYVKGIQEDGSRNTEEKKTFKNDAIAREMGALKLVVKAIEEYKLENEYPCQDLEKRMSELEQQKSNKKRDDAGASVSISKKQQQQQQQQQQSNKRSRQLASIQNHPQYGLA